MLDVIPVYRLEIDNLSGGLSVEPNIIPEDQTPLPFARSLSLLHLKHDTNSH